MLVWKLNLVLDFEKIQLTSLLAIKQHLIHSKLITFHIILTYNGLIRWRSSMLSLRLLIMFIWEMAFNYLIYLIIQFLVSGIVFMKLKVMTLRKSSIYIYIYISIEAYFDYIYIIPYNAASSNIDYNNWVCCESHWTFRACTDIETK